MTENSSTYEEVANCANNHADNRPPATEDKAVTSTNVDIDQPSTSKASEASKNFDKGEKPQVSTTNDENITPSTSKALQQLTSENEHTTAVSTTSVDERTCWICFATDHDDRQATWVRPCKCRGTMQWVHESCLYRWIDEKQRGLFSNRAVTCPQCQTEYMIISPSMGKVASILESWDFFVKRMSPFMAAGLFVSSLYWSAVTYGAVTYIQVFGHRKGLQMLEESDVLTLLIGLPAIPVSLVLGRMVQWESAVITLMRNRHSFIRKLPVLKCIISSSDDDNDEEEQTTQPTTRAQNQVLPPYSEPISGTRVFCGALLMPSISILVGRLLYESVENRLHRTLLGGLTFVAVKGLLKIYLIDRQCIRRKKRRIVDYTEENLQAYHAQNSLANSRRMLLESSSLRLLADLQ